MFVIFAFAACEMVEKPCPDSTCKAITRFNGRVIKCVCNTDLCNSNITWSTESDGPHLSFSNSGGRNIVWVLDSYHN